MGITISIEIYEDNEGEFRWKFLDSNGTLHGPSVAFESRSSARADIDSILATFMDKD